jgi:hypothetical protein
VRFRIWLVAVALSAGAAIGLGACSSSSSTDGAAASSGGGAGNVVKFCKDDATIDNLSAPNQASVLQVLKANQAVFDDLPKSAPPAWRAAATKVASAVDKAIATGKLTAFTAADSAIGHQIDAFCKKQATTTSP